MKTRCVLLIILKERRAKIRKHWSIQKMYGYWWKKNTNKRIFFCPYIASCFKTHCPCQHTVFVGLKPNMDLCICIEADSHGCHQGSHHRLFSHKTHTMMIKAHGFDPFHWLGNQPSRTCDQHCGQCMGIYSMSHSKPHLHNVKRYSAVLM